MGTALDAHTSRAAKKLVDASLASLAWLAHQQLQYPQGLNEKLVARNEKLAHLMLRRVRGELKTNSERVQALGCIGTWATTWRTRYCLVSIIGRRSTWLSSSSTTTT